MKLSDDPDNSDQHRIVIRTATHKRPRVDNSRFSSQIELSCNKDRDITDMSTGKSASNWLGSTWFKEINNKVMPTLAQIEEGLIAEALEQLRLAMFNVKNSEV
jgi:hypothetical protein